MPDMNATSLAEKQSAPSDEDKGPIQMAAAVVGMAATSVSWSRRRGRNLLERRHGSPVS